MSDYIEHYGVKGMKWKYHKPKAAVNTASAYNRLQTMDVESLVDKAKLVGKKGSSSKASSTKAPKEKKESSGKAAKEPKEKSEKETKATSPSKTKGMKTTKQYFEWLRQENQKNLSQLPKAREKVKELDDKEKKKKLYRSQNFNSMLSLIRHDDIDDEMPIYLAELELSDDTLEHYGVKGMKWRHKKGKKVTKSRRKNTTIIKPPKDPFGEAFVKWLDSSKGKLYNNSEAYRKYYNWTQGDGVMTVQASSGNKKYTDEEIDYWSKHTDELDNGPGDLQFKYEMHEEIKKRGGHRRRQTNK